MPTLTVQTTGVNDTFMDKGSPTTNNGATEDILIGPLFGNPNLYRGLLKFDLSSIPAGSVVTSAILSLWTGTDFGDRTGTIEVYRVLRAWIDTQATWNVYTTGNGWGTVGCDNTTTDREASNIGSQALGDVVLGTQCDITLTNSAIQAMITGGAFTNNGFLLKNANETDWDGGHLFRSTNYVADSTKRPKLVVDYTTPAGVASSALFFAHI